MCSALKLVLVFATDVHHKHIHTTHNIYMSALQHNASYRQTVSGYAYTIGIWDILSSVYFWFYFFLDVFVFFFFFCRLLGLSAVERLQSNFYGILLCCCLTDGVWVFNVAKWARIKIQKKEQKLSRRSHIFRFFFFFLSISLYALHHVMVFWFNFVNGIWSNQNEMDKV